MTTWKCRPVLVNMKYSTPKCNEVFVSSHLPGRWRCWRPLLPAPASRGPWGPCCCGMPRCLPSAANRWRNLWRALQPEAHRGTAVRFTSEAVTGSPIGKRRNWRQQEKRWLVLEYTIPTFPSRDWKQIRETYRNNRSCRCDSNLRPSQYGPTDNCDPPCEHLTRFRRFGGLYCHHIQG
jgi:hypothetical protein